MKVKDVMKADVKTVEPDASLKDAIETMNKFGIGSLVVVDDGKLAGILTERDILKQVAKDVVASKVTVKATMTKNVVLIEPDADLSEAVDAMTQYKIKKLPVVLHGSLIGIVTASDVCMAEPKVIAQLAKLIAIPGDKKPMAG